MKIKRLQLIRNIVQIIFLGLLIFGLYMNLRMALMIFLPGALLFGNFFCGWVCPYGTIQEVFGLIGRKLFKKRFRMPRHIQKYLQIVRYPLFLLVIIGIGSAVLGYINGYGSFFKMFMEGFVLLISTIIMLSFLVIAIFFERPFCNYLCTEGVKYGVLSFLRIFSIKRNPEICISCRKCDRSCSMNIVISDKTHIRNAQCINCFECISACPIENTLSYGFSGIKFKTRTEIRINR